MEIILIICCIPLFVLVGALINKRKNKTIIENRSNVYTYDEDNEFIYHLRQMDPTLTREYIKQRIV